MYSVGQILFLVPKGERKIYPCKVLEEVSKKTLSGIEITYNVVYNDMTMQLPNVSVDVYSSYQELRKFLIGKATEGIDFLIKDALNEAHEKYQFNVETVVDKNEISKDDEFESFSYDDPAISYAADKDSDLQTIKLEDGSIAKIRMPKGL